MNKILTFICSLSSFTYASIYYAQSEPISTYNIKSSVSSKVLYTNKQSESTNAQNTVIVKLDDNIDKISLKESKNKLINLNKILVLEKNTLKSFSKVSSKSRFDKDNQKIKILNISSNISDIKIKIATLENSISNKTLVEKDNYIYNIAVEVGDYVTPGKLLYTAYNISKAKLILYIPINEIDNIKNKTILLDDKPTNLKIDKLYKVADKKHLSSFKCEIKLDEPVQLSKLIKVEFK